MTGCPIHRVLCDEWDESAPPAAFAVAVAVEIAFLVVIPAGNLLVFLPLPLWLSFP
jgi:hypothetical protein